MQSITEVGRPLRSWVASNVNLRPAQCGHCERLSVACAAPRLCRKRTFASVCPVLQNQVGYCGRKSNASGRRTSGRGPKKCLPTIFDIKAADWIERRNDSKSVKSYCSEKTLVQGIGRTKAERA